MAVVRVHHYSADESDYEEFRKRRDDVIAAAVPRNLTYVEGEPS